MDILALQLESAVEPLLLPNRSPPRPPRADEEKAVGRESRLHSPLIAGGDTCPTPSTLGGSQTACVSLWFKMLSQVSGV